MQMSRCDWPDCVVKTPYTGVCSVIRLNAVKLMTAKHCMSLTKFCELLACQCMSLYSYRELNIMQRTYTFA